MNKRFNKKRRGVLGMDNLPKIAIAIALSVFVVGLTTLFLAEFNDATTNANATTVLNAGIDGLAEFNNWWGLLVISGIFLILFAVMFIIAKSSRSGGL